MWKRLLATFIIVAAGLSSAAKAQRGNETPRVPRAVTDAQLQRWCDTLAVSDGQRHAIELEFEQYLDDFEPLRLEMGVASVKNPESSLTDLDFVRQLPSFVERTRAADESLFARIEPLLTDDQRAWLPRIRMQRDRSLLCGLRAVDHIIGDGVPDLRALLESLDPPPEVIDPLRPTLDDYESRLTAGVRGLFVSLMQLCATDVPQQWFSYASSRTPMEPAMLVDINRVVEDVRALRAMNRRFFESTAPSLPDDLRRRWRDEFVLYAYGSARDSTQMWVMSLLDRALRSELTEAERQAVLTMQDQARNAEQEALGNMMTLLDDEAIRPAGPGGARGSDQLMGALSAAREKAMATSTEIRKSMLELLGSERVKQLSSQPSDSGDARYAQASWRAMYGLVSYESRVSSRASKGVSAVRAEPLLAWPMSRDELEMWLAALQAPEESREAIHSMYDDYIKAIEPTLKPLQENAFRNSPNVMMREKPEDPLARARAAEKTQADLRAAVDAADAVFLQQLRDALGADIDAAMWDRLMRLRGRTLLGIDMTWAAFGAPNIAGGIDLVQLLAQQRLTSGEWALIADAVAAYETELDPLLRQQRDSMARTNFERTAMRDGWRPEGEWFRDDAGQNERYAKIGDLNRTTVQAVGVLLSAESAARITRAFNLRAYPSAFDDPASMDAALRQALDLADLTPEQREAVTTVRVAFDEAYREALTRLIELCAAAPMYMPMAGRTITEDVARAEEQFNEDWAHATDARDEANRRALRGLRVTLLPAQMRRITLPAME